MDVMDTAAPHDYAERVTGPLTTGEGKARVYLPTASPQGLVGGWWVGRGVDRGGMRRKRRQTRSKIINRLSAEHQVK